MSPEWTKPEVIPVLTKPKFMKRITPQVKAIADAHLKAKVSGMFDNPEITNAQELKDALWAGKTFSGVLEEIEIRYCTTGSMLLGSCLDHTSNNYKSGVYKGFKTLLQ